MFGFPLPLFDSTASAIIKLAPVADGGFPKLSPTQTFYSIKAGNWTDTSVWQTASGQVGLLPSANDDVCIRHNISSNIAANTGLQINNLFISDQGILTMTGTGSSVFLSILGNLQCRGTIDGSGGQLHYLRLYGTNNRLDNYLIGANTNFVYAGNTNQDILSNISYQNIYFDGSGTKFLKADTTILGNIGNVPLGSPNLALPVLECGSYNLTVNGTTAFGITGFSKNNSGNLLFIGAVTLSSSNAVGFVLDGNPDVEFRGGVNFGNHLGPFRSGTGTWSFTTNNQTLQTNFSTPTITFNSPLSIASGITLTVSAVATFGPISLNNTINSGSGTSKLLQATSSVLIFATQNAAENSMSTGIIDFTTNANTVRFSGTYSATIPAQFTSFSSLGIDGTGTKTVSANTSASGNLNVGVTNSSTVLELSTFNLTVTGTSTIGAGSGAATSGKLSKTGAGSVLFTGLLTLTNTNPAAIDFSGGNPTVECRGGITATHYDTAGTRFKSGTGQWKFSTNNQTIAHFGANSINSGSSSTESLIFSCPILISGAITLTIGDTSSSNGLVVFNDTVNGDNASSTLTVKTLLMLNATTITCMTTGIFDATTFTTSIVGYTASASYNIPNTSYQGLYVAGTGTKTLSGNTTVSTTLNISKSAILELSTYNLTVTGTTVTGEFATENSQAGGTIQKSGAGSVTFIGLLTIANDTPSALDFSSGNPTVEVRGGIQVSSSISTSRFKSGTGQWSFTTNNQNIKMIGGSSATMQFDAPMLISGAITLTVLNTNVGNFTLNTLAIDGDNASSTLLMGVSTGGCTLNYKSATKPFVTNGILDASTNTNTWIYGNGNQDILGGPSVGAKQVYKNLTLNGTGTKTLQGYVSVLNTYTLTAPATLNNNGFTLTNP